MTESLVPRPHRLFVFELLSAFVLAGGFSIGAVELMRRGSAAHAYQTLLSWQYVFVVLIAIVVIVSVLKKIRSRLIWEIAFSVTFFLGVWYLALLILPFGWGIALASVLSLLALILRTGLWHDLFVLVGCVGVAVDFAGWLAPDVLLVGLVVITLYDTLAGPPGGPVEELASSLARTGTVPGLILVPRLSDLSRPVLELVRGQGMLLGAGDLILPLTLVIRASFTGAWAGGLVLAGLLGGALLLGRNSSHPRAALPPLVLGACLPFFVLRLMGAL